jgi:hypothetical protein
MKAQGFASVAKPDSFSASPILFSRRAAVAPVTVAQYLGTDTEVDSKTSPAATALLFGQRNPVAAATASQYVGTETELDPKGVH